jgi:sugar (pentulose or hexulose) kinase
VNIDRYLNQFVHQRNENEQGKYALFNKLAAQCQPGARGLMINLCQSDRGFRSTAIDLGAPYDVDQVCRALMESVAFVMRNKIERLAEAGVPAERLTMVGGPAESPIWPWIVANVTGLPLTLTNGQTAGAVGAAIMAALGAGLFQNLREAVEVMGGKGETITPADEDSELYDALYQKYRERYGDD